MIDRYPTYYLHKHKSKDFYDSLHKYFCHNFDKKLYTRYSNNTICIPIMGNLKSMIIYSVFDL